MNDKIIAFVEDDTADGGLGMVFRSLADFFAEKYKVLYLSTRPNNGRIPDNIEYVQFRETREFEPHTNGLKRSLSGVNPLKQVLNEKKPDLAISFGFYGNIRLNLASLGLKNKVLISERGNATRFKGIYSLLISTLFARTDCIVFQSQAALNAYPGPLKKKGVVINNAIFKSNLPDASEEEWDNRIVSVGRIHPDKNFPLLVKAFSLIADEYPNLHLEIYGEEEPGSTYPYLKDLQQLTDELKLHDRVHFMGQSDQIGRDIAGARLFVLSSVLEGMPNALIEAMACGLPCVTTDFLPGCANEIVHNGVDGVIGPREGAEGLADSMHQLLSNSELSRSVARKAVEIKTRLSKKNIFAKWEDTVSSLI